MDNRKNTILLTVIAVATLLVAVVGATFAFFSARTGTAAAKDVSVRTYTTDSTLFSIDKVLEVKATQDNFNQETGTNVSLHSETATGTATYKATDATAGSFDKKYDATVDIALNNFEYTTTEGHTTDPELILVVTKNGSAVNTATVDGTNLTYVQNIKGANDTNAISGFDITTVAKDKTISFGTHTLTSVVTAAEGGNTATEAKDTWTFQLYFINYDWDQEYNTNKTFSGQIKLAAHTGA